MKKRLIITCVLFLLIAASPFAQVKQYFFSHFTTRNGLLSNNTQGIVQDEKGFLWVGSLNGLQRFDGNKFINFQHNPNDVHSIADNEIWQLLIDKKKNLWLTFGNGKVGIFNTTTFRFTEVKVQLPSERIKDAFKRIYEDSKGNIMILFPGHGLLTFNEKANLFSAAYNFISAPAGWRIQHLLEEPGANKYWLTCNEGLVVYNANTKKLSYRGHNEENHPAINHFEHAIELGVPYIDKKKRLWFQTWTNAGAPSFHCYDLANNKVVIDSLYMGFVLRGYCDPKQIIEQSDGRLIVTGTPILAEYLEDKKTFARLENFAGSLNEQYNNIVSSYVDREQNVWLCTRTEGLYKFNPSTQSFVTVSHTHPITGVPGANAVLSFVQTSDGSILAGAWGDGMLRYDSNLNPIPINIKGIKENNTMSVWSMHKRKDGKIWMGRQEDGGNIMVYDEKEGKAIEYKAFYRITIRQVVEDHYGNMWVGTQRLGAFKWTPSKAVKKFEDGFSRLEAVPATLINKLYVDNDGYLWVATIADGIYKIDPKTDKTVEHLTDKSNPRLLKNAVGPVLQYNDSLMLIAAGGLVIYNTKRQTTSFMTVADGLPSNHIMSILKDEAGYVWLAMMNGLCRLNLFKKTINFYDRQDGMANDNFTFAASYRLRDGRFLLGTNKDFVVFRPENITSSGVPPDPTITEFRLSNKPLRMDSLLKQQTVNLTYDNNSVLIDFASLTNLQNNKITYYYMLENLDKDWIKADNGQRAIYPYLAPGKYTFKVKAENTDGVMSRHTTKLNIHVSPPFWETWWFYSLLALVSAALLFWLDRERMKRKEAIHKMRSDIAGNLHEEINVALNNINILSEMAKLKADKEPQKSKEFIEQIHSRSHNMITAMDDMLWSIDPNNDSMEKTVLRMKEYVDALNNRHGLNMELLIDEKVNELKLGMQLRHEAFILFKETIAALLKACANNCKIYVGAKKSGLVYTVEFKNQAFEPQQFEHLLEREDIKKRLHFLGALSEIQSHKESSVFELVLPIDN